MADWSYSYGGNSGTFDVSEYLEVIIAVKGAGGAGGTDDENDADLSGGDGGYAEIRVDVSNSNRITAYTGEGGIPGNEMSQGEFNGGGGSQYQDPGGGGASTSVELDGSKLAWADAGGGAGANNAVSGYYGGGGGARGGGGVYDGEDAEGTGFGGQGGDPNNGGENGGQEVLSDSRIVETITTTKGGGEFGGTGTGDYGQDGRIEVTITERPSRPEPPINFEATIQNENQINLSWSEPSSQDDYDEWRIYRSSGSGADTSDTLITTLSPGTTNYSDTGLDEGKTYHYAITAYIADDGLGNSYESDIRSVSDTTPLPAPTNFEIINKNLPTLDLSWNINSVDEDSVEAEFLAQDGNSWQVLENMSPGTESVSTELPSSNSSGFLRIEAKTSDVSSYSNIVDINIVGDKIKVWKNGEWVSLGSVNIFSTN